MMGQELPTATITINGLSWIGEMVNTNLEKDADVAGNFDYLGFGNYLNEFQFLIIISFFFVLIVRLLRQ